MTDWHGGMQAYLIDVEVQLQVITIKWLSQKSDYCNNVTQKIIIFFFFWFPSAYKNMLTLYCRLFSQSVSSFTQSCLTLCDPMNHSTWGLSVHHQLPEFTQTYVYWVGNAIQPPHPLSSPSPPAPNPFRHQGLFQWVNSSHEVAKVLEFQLQHQSFQWTPRTDLL